MTALGIVFRPQFPPESLRATAQAADEAGVEELWVWEDCFLEAGVSTATAALAWTQHLTVGIGVLPVPLRNPAVAAMEIATLARLFPGRVEAGLGHGVLDWMGQVGARVESPMTLLREYVTAVRRLLAGDTVTTEGRYVRLRDVALDWPPPEPVPLHLGAVGPKTIALAGELSDGLVLGSGATPEDVSSARKIFDEARAGRPGRLTVYLPAVTGPGARSRYAAEMEYWRVDPHKEVGVFGDAPAIADAVRRWADAGADAVILQPTGGDDPVEYARFVGEQVRPRLR